MNITYATYTNQGPRAVNEDFLDCWVSKTGETIACIADGLGGMGGGDIASRLAVNKFKNFLTDITPDEKVMLAATYSAHEAIRFAQENNEANRMATTFTAISLSNAGIAGVHCGDSRAVIARGQGIKRLTKDHSEGQRLFDAGKLSKKELLSYHRKNILESALGSGDLPKIDIIKFDLLPGDKIILTTDGVHNIIFLRELHALCSKSSTPRTLIDRTIQAVQAHGPIDNFSIIAIFTE